MPGRVAFGCHAEAVLGQGDHMPSAGSCTWQPGDITMPNGRDVCTVLCLHPLNASCCCCGVLVAAPFCVLCCAGAAGLSSRQAAQRAAVPRHGVPLRRRARPADQHTVCRALQPRSLPPGHAAAAAPSSSSACARAAAACWLCQQRLWQPPAEPPDGQRVWPARPLTRGGVLLRAVAQRWQRVACAHRGRD